MAKTWPVVYFRRWPHSDSLRRIEQLDCFSLTMIDQSTPAEEADRLLAQARIYAVGATYQEIPSRLCVDKKLIQRAPNLLAVLSQGAGYDTVDVDSCRAADIVVCNQAGCNAEAVAEHALGMMLVLSKRIVDSDRVMRRQAGIDRTDYIGRDVHGKTLGIIGLGATGGRLASLSRDAFAMQVIGFDPHVEAERFDTLQVTRVDEVDDLLGVVDFLAVCCPLNESSRDMISTDRLRRMRPSAYLIATGRGGVIDEDGLSHALQQGWLAGAGIDVWQQEPPPPCHKLLSLDNVIASPHIAGVTIDARIMMGESLTDQCIALQAGRKPNRMVNPDIWDRFIARFSAIC